MFMTFISYLVTFMVGGFCGVFVMAFVKVGADAEPRAQMYATHELVSGKLPEERSH